MHIGRVRPLGSTYTYVDQVVVSGGAVAVPSDFLGWHVHRWPKAREGDQFITSPPDIPYGWYRTHDYAGYFGNAGPQWRNLMPSDLPTSQAMYDAAPVAWARFDEFIHAHWNRGAKILYVLSATPPWLAQPNQQVLDNYGFIGGASCPTDLTATRRFVRAVLERANGDGVRRITAIEPWNEPEPANTRRAVSAVSAAADTITYAGTVRAANTQVFFESTGSLPGGIQPNTLYFLRTANNTTSLSLTSNGPAIDITSAGSGTITMVVRLAFFWGTALQLANLMREVYQEVRAFDAGITVLSPGFTGNPNVVSEVLNTADSTATLASQYVDGMAYHFYDRGIGLQYRLVGNDLVKRIDDVRAQMALVGFPAEFPLWGTEQGFQSTSSVGVEYFWSRTDAEQAVRLWRYLVVCAAMGNKQANVYSWDNEGLTMGQLPPHRSPEKRRLIQAFSAEVPGKVITDCYINNDGSVTVKTAGANAITR